MTGVEFSIALVLAMAGGAGGSAIISGLHDRWRFKAERSAKKEDRQYEKDDKTEEVRKIVSEYIERDGIVTKEFESKLETMQQSDKAQTEALKLIMLDRIIEAGSLFVERGDITYDERRRFHAMHDCYHNGLGGNGDADLIVAAVDALPIKK